MNSHESVAAFLLGLMVFMFGVVGGLFLATADSRFLDPQTVKTAPTECQLRRFGNAQKYVESCTPAFKSAAP